MQKAENRHKTPLFPPHGRGHKKAAQRLAPLDSKLARGAEDIMFIIPQTPWKIKVFSDLEEENFAVQGVNV